MPDLRTRFRGAEHIPTPDLWPDIARRQPRPAGPEPGIGRRMLVGAFALMLAGAGIAVAVRALGPDGPPVADETASVTPTRPLTGEPRITAEIPLADGRIGGGLAVGAGSAWVGVLPEKRDGVAHLIRIDLATNEVVAEIPVQETPYRKRIAATDKAVWVASFSGTLERIDPATNTVVATVELPGDSVSAIAADADAVWAIAVDEGGEEWIGTLVRVDPSTNAIVAQIPLSRQVAGYEDEVVLGAGSVWVLGVRWFEEEDAEYGSDLIRIDPSTNQVVARIPVGGFHMVVGIDGVWVRFPSDGVFDGVYQGVRGERWLWTQVDPQTNEPSDPFEFADQGLRLVTPDALWSVGYDEQENVRVTRFDPKTLQVQTSSEPAALRFHDAVIDPASGTVWISAVYSVVRVDIAEEGPSPAPALPALTRGTAQHDPEGGIFLITPPDWSFLVRPSGPYEPKTLFAVANYPIERGGECAPTTALEALPGDGALAWVTEYGDTQGNEFPPRPEVFSLDPSSLANYECSGTHATYMFRFQDQDRYFQVHVAFGEQAGQEVRDQMVASLSSLVVDRCPPVEPPVLVSEFGSLVPDTGTPGATVTVSGPTGRGENWFWYPFDMIEVWWSIDRIGVPQENSDKVLLATIDPGRSCDFTTTFRVPEVQDGRYLVTILGYHDEGFGWMGERGFTVAG